MPPDDSQPASFRSSIDDHTQSKNLPEIRINIIPDLNDNTPDVIGDEYFDEPPENLKRQGSKAKAKSDHKKSTYRSIVTLAGLLSPISLIANGMYLTGSWVELSGGPTSTPALGVGGIIFSSLFPIIAKGKIPDYALNNDHFAALSGFIVSFVILLLLLYDFIKTDYFAKRGSGMSRSQRKLHFSTIAIYAWACLGGVLMMFIEKFPFYKGLYLSLVTVTTIGFGDYYPTTNFSRSVTICWFFIGIVLLGLYLLNTRDVVIQLMSERYHRQLVKLTQKKNEFDKSAVKKYKMMELQARQSNSLKSKIYKWYLRKGISKKKLKDFEVPKWMKNSQSFFRSKT
ncbi:putative potassium channel protein 2, partial [Smittium culicis]